MQRVPIKRGKGGNPGSIDTSLDGGATRTTGDVTRKTAVDLRVVIPDERADGRDHLVADRTEQADRQTDRQARGRRQDTNIRRVSALCFNVVG